GIAVAKQAYRSYRQILGSAGWDALETQGARPQRLLFASTGTKDPAKPDTYYLEALAAPDTINTIPPATLEEFVDHGRVGEMLPADGGDADATIADRKSTRLNSSHVAISYAVFCLKKKNTRTSESHYFAHKRTHEGVATRHLY